MRPTRSETCIIYFMIAELGPMVTYFSNKKTLSKWDRVCPYTTQPGAPLLLNQQVHCFYRSGTLVIKAFYGRFVKLLHSVILYYRDLSPRHSTAQLSSQTRVKCYTFIIIAHSARDASINVYYQYANT